MLPSKNNQEMHDMFISIHSFTSFDRLLEVEAAFLLFATTTVANVLCLPSFGLWLGAGALRPPLPGFFAVAVTTTTPRPGRRLGPGWTRKTCRRRVERRPIQMGLIQWDSCARVSHRLISISCHDVYRTWDVMVINDAFW